MDELRDRLGITWKYSSPGHHNTTGATERANQTLFLILRKISNFTPQNWARNLQKATDAMNVSYNRSIGASPFILQHAREQVFPID
ncbi:hypothetical protein ENBRE01_2825 [Enteropsectra breve]|nr:hypothetical protein ENBRE01_2825 [Enteropsectra breve]